MKKWAVIIGIGLIMICLPITPVSARAGGSTGGGGTGGTSGGSGGGSTTTSYYNDGTSGGRSTTYYGRGTTSNRGAIIGTMITFGVFLFYQATLAVRRARSNAQAPHDPYPIDDDLAKEFEPLFYKVEDAWSADDEATLQQAFTPKYFGLQRAILFRWRKQGKINRLDNVAIVQLEQEASSPDRPHVVVTAQARDYFEYPDQPAAYNQSQHDQAYIERFTEVWELQRLADGQLIVSNIRQ
ncbi:hypothetical protein [Lacticaseibacillus saniviri]|uniref:Tim44-like domain-containing protein n=1 Tax=Lacticaseibacillus saniviri JCM 17471 = DSM 24301 TaxID=1293598 RepID=A0A0R2MND1_9LACO|nr:hypothetical protein [Lacticaseibacillus saniviri]KRO15175.1 hypothetical protein IV56_GL000266 [Lacticaseibacillus saniviri JCM 17471 = DSM 24301]MCG4281132.1 hypothetical protein [Lacticaseibacillus saniviri]